MDLLVALKMGIFCSHCFTEEHFVQSQRDRRDPSKMAPALFLLRVPHYAVPRIVITAYPGMDNGVA